MHNRCFSCCTLRLVSVRSLFLLGVLACTTSLSSAHAQTRVANRPAAKHAAAPGQFNDAARFQSVRELTRWIHTKKAEFAARSKRDPDDEERERRERAAQKHSKKKRVHRIVINDADEAAGVDYLEAYLYFLKERAYPLDTLNWEAYGRAAAQRDQMPPARLASPDNNRFLGAHWEFVGPQNLSVPYRTYYGQGTINGRINAIAFDPQTPTTFYFGGASGGVWKTTDDSATFTPLSDAWPFLHVSSIAVHPTNSSTLYAGTGDFDGRAAYSNGIMKSIDGGQTWTNQGQGQFANTAVSAIVIDPETPETLTITTGHGPAYYGKVWRTTDGGAHWNAVIQTTIPWSDLKVSAKNGSGLRHYYAAGHDYSGQVWRSDDRGVNWTRLTTPMSSGYQDSIELATSPTDPDTVYLIAGEDEKLWKSVNAGATWTDISANFINGNQQIGFTYNWSQSWYDAYLACSTRTDTTGHTFDVLYAGLIDIERSRDGGTSWQSLGKTYTDSALVHNDQHAMAIKPGDPSTLLAGNDGGLYRLSDNANNNSWTFTSLNAHLGLTQFYYMAAHPTDASRLLGGAQDNASPVSTSTLSQWDNVSGGDGAGCAINTINGDIQYASAQYLFVYSTEDNWQTENYIAPNYGNEPVPFIAPLAIDSKTPNLLYAATNYLYRWDENTQTWTNHVGNTSLTGGNYVRAIAVAPGDSSRIYTGSVDGQLWMSTNNGASWQQITTGSPGLPNRAFTRIAVNPTNASEVWVAVSGTGTGHVYHCANTGANPRVWQNVSGSGQTALPDVPTSAIALDLDNPATNYFVANDVGIFYTPDSGAHWYNATQPLGLPNVGVRDLKAVPGTRYLNAATFGRGMWRIALPTSIVLDSLAITPTTVKSGTTATGTVQLNAVATGTGVTIALSSSDHTVATVPGSVVVPAGSAAATFPITTLTVSRPTTVTITATFNNTSQTATLTVIPNTTPGGKNPIHPVNPPHHHPR